MKKPFALMAAMIFLISGFGSAEAPSVESEDTMANISQVNIGGVVYKLKDAEAREQISGLKSALSVQSENNKLKNLPFISERTSAGITFKYVGGGCVHISGTSTDTSMYTIYEGALPEGIALGETYDAIFNSGTDSVLFQIYGYDSNNSAKQLFSGSGSGKVTFDAQYSSRFLFRIRVANSGVTIDKVLCPSIQPTTEEQLYSLQRDVLIDVADFSEIETATKHGITFTVDKISRIITVDGTATATVVYFIKEDYAITGFNEILISGGADGGDSATYNLAFYEAGEGRIAYLTNSDEERYITLNPNRVYSFGIAVFAGQTVNNLVFKPRGYVSGKLLDLRKKTEKIDDLQPRFNYYTGTAFICECGEHIYIDSKSFRVYDKKNKTYTTWKSDTEIIEGGSSSVRYICFDGEHFSISGTYTDTAIAYVVNKIVTPLIDGIIPDYRAIQDGYLRSGSEYTINFARTPIDAYAAYDSETDVKISKQAYTYTTTGTKRYRVGRESIAFALNENAVNINNKKILIIGDSFVARGYIQNWLHELNGTLTFVGTKTTQAYNYKSEGVSGSRLYYFTDPETSPFYFNGQLNLASYLSTYNVEMPDYVVINSAINHGAFNNDEHGSYLQNLTDLVNMIKDYNSGIKIYVTYGANYAMEPGSDYGYSISRYEEVRKCGNSVYDVEGITVVPVDYCLVDELDYDYKTYNYYGDEIKILSDCVHPKENSGFKKIAYMIYNYLGL